MLNTFLSAALMVFAIRYAVAAEQQPNRQWFCTLMAILTAWMAILTLEGK